MRKVVALLAFCAATAFVPVALLAQDDPKPAAPTMEKPGMAFAP